MANSHRYNNLYRILITCKVLDGSKLSSAKNTSGRYIPVEPQTGAGSLAICTTEKDPSNISCAAVARWSMKPGKSFVN